MLDLGLRQQEEDGHGDGADAPDGRVGDPHLGAVGGDHGDPVTAPDAHVDQRACKSKLHPAELAAAVLRSLVDQRFGIVPNACVELVGQFNHVHVIP